MNRAAVHPHPEDARCGAPLARVRRRFCVGPGHTALHEFLAGRRKQAIEIQLVQAPAGRRADGADTVADRHGVRIETRPQKVIVGAAFDLPFDLFPLLVVGDQRKADVRISPEYVGYGTGDFGCLTAIE